MGQPKQQSCRGGRIVVFVRELAGMNRTVREGSSERFFRKAQYRVVVSFFRQNSYVLPYNKQIIG